MMMSFTCKLTTHVNLPTRLAAFGDACWDLVALNIFAPRGTCSSP